MCKAFLFGVLLCMGGAFAADNAAPADAPPSTKESTGGQPSASPAPQSPASPADAAKEHPRDQFWFVGTSNYHLLLHESEDQIDRQLNAPFGTLLCNWKRPTTFRDWSNDFLLWDLWGGYGFDLSEQFSWAVYGGGGAGVVPNDNHYSLLGIPLRVRADFTRISLMAGTAITWYPFGRPAPATRNLWKNFAGTRPMAEMNVGYSYQVAIGDVKLSVPILGRLAHIRDEKQYHLAWTSPRLGIEVPLTKNNTLNILGGYLFFVPHSSEFNGGLLEFFIRHRF